MTKATALYARYKSAFDKGTEALSADRDKAISSLVRRHVRAGNLEEALRIASDLNDKPITVSMLYENIACVLAEKGESLDRVQEFFKKSLERLEESKAQLRGEPTYLTTAEWKAERDRKYAEYVVDVYAWILFERGEIREAILPINRK